MERQASMSLEERDASLADFWRRALAWSADAALFIVLGGMMYNLVDSPVTLLLTLVAYLVYSAVTEGSSLEGTVGKVLLGLHVTDLDGSPLSGRRSTGRAVAKAISLAVFPLGYAIVTFSDGKRALHDLLASTLVLRRRRNQ